MQKDTLRNYPETERLKEDAASLKDNAIQLAQRVRDEGEQKVRQAKDAVSEGYERFKSSSADQLRDVEKRVKDKPLQSIAIAFGVGLIASYIFGRR